MEFDEQTDLEMFLKNIQKLISGNMKQILINSIVVKLGEDFGWSLCLDDRVPQKNIEEINEREKLASAYRQRDYMDMAAIEFEECARELIFNCINATFNISSDNINRLNDYLNEARKCWHNFSGDLILPSQSETA